MKKKHLAKIASFSITKNLLLKKEEKTSAGSRGGFISYFFYKT
jgi:hypothetical protein